MRIEMVKMRVFILLAVILGFSACQNDKKVNNEKEVKSGVVSKEHISPQNSRDTSINLSNAYNDIFLDSNEVERFSVSENLSPGLISDIRDFYKARNYEFAWFATSGLIEQAVSFHSLFASEQDTATYNRALNARIDKVRAEGDTCIDPKNFANIKTELLLTRKLIEYTELNYKDVQIAATILGTFIPAKKKSITEIADSVLQNINNKSYATVNPKYGLLKDKLQIYVDIVKSGGWQSIMSSASKYKVGGSAPIIPLIKSRLFLSRELQVADTSLLFTPELENAIKTYQLSHGLKSTGIITPYFINNLNISALSRLQQILINMQRMRWIPSRQEGKLIIVNIPEFEVYVDSGTTNLFHMNVVVGAEGHNTTMFSGKINQIVFSPYWNVPTSIVKKEILPHIKHNDSYLKKRNMEITGHSAGLPIIRQKPGENNALGRVKFLFPNSYRIYLHDSPERKFFSRSARSLSHGCIRLSDAPKLAHYLLKDSQTWSYDKIESAMDSHKQHFVRLAPSVPVIITYYTSWVDPNGTLHFANDIYGHDKIMAAKMFTDAQVE